MAAVSCAGMIEPDDLPIVEFADVAELRAWLELNQASSLGVWIRVGKKRSAWPTVTFEDVLVEGLCFGWSESKRRSWDLDSYLQRFTPRRRTHERALPRAQSSACRVPDHAVSDDTGRAARGRHPDAEDGEFTVHGDRHATFDGWTRAWSVLTEELQEMGVGCAVAGSAASAPRSA